MEVEWLPSDKEREIAYTASHNIWRHFGKAVARSLDWQDFHNLALFVIWKQTSEQPCTPNFLYTVVFRDLQDYAKFWMRREKREVPIEDADAVPDYRQDVEAAAIERNEVEHTPLLDLLMAPEIRFTQMQRTAMQMHYLQGDRWVDIAESLSITPGLAAWHHQRALLRLRQFFTMRQIVLRNRTQLAAGSSK